MLKGISIWNSVRETQVASLRLDQIFSERKLKLGKSEVIVFQSSSEKPNKNTPSAVANAVATSLGREYVVC